MGSSGYKSYHGRRTRKHNLLVILLVLALIAACVVLFFQQYITYSDDGGLRLEIPLPWHDKSPDPPAPPLEPEDMNLVIDEPEPVELEPEEAPPIPAYEERRLVDLTDLQQTPEALRASLEDVNANGFVCTVKNTAGQVLLRLPSAMGSAVIDGAPDPQLLTPFLQMEDTVSVARIDCFHDSYYAWANMETAGLCQSSGYIWYDAMSYHWLDPTKEAARRYILDLCLDCAQMGFDELLLEELSYPYAGKLEKIDYRDADRSHALESFLLELREALASYDVKVSLLLPEDLFSPDGDERSATTGQDMGLLLPLADAVYVAAEDPGAVEAAVRSTGDDEFPALVTVSDQPAPEGSWYRTATP